MNTKIAMLIMMILRIIGSTLLPSHEPAGPSGGLLQRQLLVRLFGSYDRYFPQTDAGYWTITVVVQPATPANLDCRSVWRSGPGAVYRQRSSQQQLLLQKLEVPDIH